MPPAFTRAYPLGMPGGRRKQGSGWNGVRSLDGKWIPYTLPVVNPNSEASLVGIDHMTSQGRVVNITVAMLCYDPGNPTLPPHSIPRSEKARIWDYRWDETSQQWGITQIGRDVSRG